MVVRRQASAELRLSTKLAEKLARIVSCDEPGVLHEGLSDREFQVLCSTAAGKSTKEIGATLHLSVKTVSTYRTRLFEKLGLENNAQLIQYALKHGLVEESRNL